MITETIISSLYGCNLDILSYALNIIMCIHRFWLDISFICNSILESVAVICVRHSRLIIIYSVSYQYLEICVVQRFFLQFYIFFNIDRLMNFLVINEYYGLNDWYFKILCIHFMIPKIAKLKTPIQQKQNYNRSEIPA